ncbi:MAG TPA: glycosyltransferase family 4 protein [Gaiellaceae bacterium]|nr:glycosyltransferase family 4 protein [Gaiellaceae bacterium]
MRVGLVCPYSWSVPGGVQRHVEGLAAALGAAGVEAEILAPADLGARGIVRLGRGVPIPSNGSVQRVALSPGSVVRTARAVRGRGYDVLHLHEPFLPAACLTALLAARVPVVATFHMYRRALLWYAVFAPLVRAAARRVDAFVAVSPAAAEYARRGTGREPEVVPNGIDHAALAALEPRRAGGRILFVGRDEPRKGLPVLLDAFRRLPGEPRLVLVGPGAAAARGERVEALGRVPEARLREELARADVLAAPSRGGESFGMVLVEAMAAGLPVVASDIPGYRDVLPAEAGRLVPPGDPDALADALAELLGNATLRERLGAAGSEASARYAWPRVAERVLAIYERVRRAGIAPGPSRFV